MILGLLVTTCCAGADWTQFRGADSSGVAADDKLPTAIGEHIAWSAELPGRGLSGPIVVGDRLFLTASSGYKDDRLHLLCFDVKTGKKSWERQFWATGRTMCHPKMCNATPTSASDGKRFFAFFSSNDVVCVDLDGNLQWMRGMTYDYPNASNSIGMSSSLAFAGDTLIVPVENMSESFTAGLDPATGINRWKLDRPPIDNWTSPVVLRGKSSDEDLVVLQSTKGISAVKPYTGFEAWHFDEPASSIPSTTAAEGILYVPSKGLTALEPAAGGAAPRVVWQANRLAPATPSPLVDGGKVYAVNGSGVLVCADTKAGQVLWQLRLQVETGDKPSRSVFSSTPVAAGGYLYVFNEDGVAMVVKTGATGEIVASHNFGETILCTPAIADGALYVRSDKHLWKIGH
jgi:outer membrane protein assembly factor BamB